MTLGVKHVVIGGAFAAILLLAPMVEITQAQPVTTTWLGGSGNWSAASRWSHGVPVNNGSTFDVAIDGGKTGTTSVVVLDIDTTINNLTIDAGDAIDIGNDHDLALQGLLANNGSLNLNGTDTVEASLSFLGNTTLSGTGQVVMSDNSHNFVVPFNTTLTHAASHTIRGAGELLFGLGGMVNHGTIIADQTNSLFVEPDASGFMNHGTMQASGLGTLFLFGGNFTNQGTMQAVNGGALVLGAGTFINTNHTIEALNGSVVPVLDQTTVIGGTLLSVATGFIVIDTSFDPTSPATFIDVTVAAGTTVVHSDFVTSPHRAEVNGTLTNNGIWHLNSTGPGHEHVLTFKNGASLSGTGSIVMSGNSDTNVIRTDGTVMTHAAGHTIRGSGQLLDGKGGMVNSGTIIADQNGPLTIRPGVTGEEVVNQGILQAISGGHLLLEGGIFTNHDRTIEALEGSKVSIAAAINGGTLSSTGSGVIEFIGAATLTDVTTASGTTLKPGDIQFGDNDASIKGTLTNNGTWHLTAGQEIMDLEFFDDGTALSGSGTVVMGTSSRITFGDFTHTHSTEHTIRGEGHLIASSAQFRNHGSIIADVSGKELIVSHATSSFGSHFINQGLMKAIEGGILRIGGAGTFVNSDGILEAGDGAKISIEGRLIDGSLLSIGSGVYDLSGGSLTDVTIPADANIIQGSTLSTRIVNSLTNNAPINITTGISFRTDDTQEPFAILSGNGTFVLNNGSIQGNLRQETGHTIRGFGRIGSRFVSPGANIINQGSIIADSDSSLIIDVEFAGRNIIGFINEGLLWATGAGGLEFGRGPFTNAAGGRIIVDTKITTSLFPSLTNEFGGIISGAGTLDVSAARFFVNSGTLSPGSSLGILGVTGDYTQTVTGAIRIEIAGTDNTTDPDNPQFDALTVTGNVSLDGTLDTALLDGFVPTFGDLFPVVTAGTRIGTFVQIHGVLSERADFALAPIYDYQNNIGLTLVTALPGDADLNGAVALGDLGVLLDNLGGRGDWTNANFNGDQFVALGDLGVWLDNLGRTVPIAAAPPPSQYVPEPGTAIVLAMGVTAMALQIRRRAA